MKLKKMTVFFITAALCTGFFAVGCGTSEEVAEETVETEEAAVEEEPEQVEEPEVVLQEIGDPDASTEVLMTNDMGEDITGLAVKTTDETEYPENMMTDDQVIEDGETVEFFYELIEPEEYFLQVTLADGSIYELSNFDLGDMSEVTLCLQEDVAYLKYLSTSKNITVNTKEIELARIEAIKAAQEVIDQIDAIGEVTSENKADVQAAREAYEALNDEQKTLVTNLSLLEEMETAVAAIEEEEAQAAAEQAAAEQAAAEQAAAEQAAAEQAAAEQAAAEQAAAEQAASSSSSDDYAYSEGYACGQQWMWDIEAASYADSIGVGRESSAFWDGYYDAISVTPQPDDWEDWHDQVIWNEEDR